ncbi:helix-turn-helix domain-containing protein [Gordonia sp. SID5947]|uniref:IclR family transcriptional regulator n=1 Tax=Gordonia sp. SID5947 TaxID=2690315 RepID=UPI00136CC29A|nr:IclR family transcriptional regulator [Gordonia sp. SID5947]MYR06870.1 helix-turn-helix domain-containing protein [Gordonia sp. SID5947]
MTALLTDDCAVNVQNTLPLSMVERMTLIMEAFDRPLARLTLDEVTQHTGLPRSTAHRILDQLVQCRWLIHAKTHYSLGSLALTLGGRELAQHELRSAASDTLQALALRTGLYVHLASLAGSEIYYLDMFGGRNGQRVPSQVGGRAPAHCTAAGKAILANLSPEYVDNQYSNVIRSGRTDYSITDIVALHQELARIRGRNGLAVERGECFGHLACVGAAIRNCDGPVGAISIVTRHGSPMEPLAPMVLRAARAISDKLMHGSRVS